MAHVFAYIVLFCLPAPLLAVALIAAARRLTWRRALLGALAAQWVLVATVAVRAHIGLQGCASSDTACLRHLAAPITPHELLHFRYELLLILGAAGTVSAIVVGTMVTWAVRRAWPQSNGYTGP
jgi:hypothetical protein